MGYTSFPVAFAAFWFAVTWCALQPVRADEHLFGYARGAETLPAEHVDLYQFTTLRAAKGTGLYQAWDYETEAEYGFTDKLQGSFALLNHSFRIRNVPEFDATDRFRVGGFDVSAKYRIKSPFIDRYGLAVRPEVGYRRYDDVAGLPEHELLVGCMLVYQRNFREDTVVLDANAGVELTWGKRPAEQYDHEVLIDGLLGVSYRFARGWFAGLEGRAHSEFPNFDLGANEHTVVFFGPSLHFAAKRWWTTFSWAYQVWGNGVDEATSRKTYAEETRNEYRLKIGLNF